ncbi:MAG: reverse transcriptase-like protein [Microbacteriaceae bacterium]
MAEYIIEADGGSRGNPGIAGSGAVVCDNTGKVLAEIGRYVGHATNNVAEYTGLVSGLEWLFQHDADASVTVKMDSKLVVEQMSGRWKIKHPDMQKKALEARELLRGKNAKFVWVPRLENARADAVANTVMDSKQSFVNTY